jgi:hypothetical protein
MSYEISPQIRLIGIVGLLLIVVAGGASIMLGRSGSSPTPQVVTTPPHQRTATTGRTQTTAHTSGKPIVHGTTTPAKTHATAKPSASTSTSKPATKAHAAAKPKAKAKPVHRGNLVDVRLPAALQWQLSQHRIVVVSVYNPQAEVDAISVAEAWAGANDAKAGFLRVNVLDNKVAGPLTALLPGGGLLPDPGVLVYRAPGVLAFRMDGFNDRSVVAQAAENAAAGQFDPTLGTTAP